MPYNRVIPRDLFNEAKLLKCLGQLALMIHNYKYIEELISLDHILQNQGFRIQQNPNDASLYCDNLICRRRDDRARIYLGTIYNDKSPYPLIYEVNNQHFGHVFKDDGAFTDEFLDLIGAGERSDHE